MSAANDNRATGWRSGWRRTDGWVSPYVWNVAALIAAVCWVAMLAKDLAQ